jgi:hypothetical protein
MSLDPNLTSQAFISILTLRTAYVHGCHYWDVVQWAQNLTFPNPEFFNTLFPKSFSYFFSLIQQMVLGYCLISQAQLCDLSLPFCCTLCTTATIAPFTLNSKLWTHLRQLPTSSLSEDLSKVSGGLWKKSAPLMLGEIRLKVLYPSDRTCNCFRIFPSFPIAMCGCCYYETLVVWPTNRNVTIVWSKKDCVE